MAKSKTRSGADLVEEVIAAHERGDGENLVDEPVPLAAAALATLRFAGGQALSPAVRRWLAFDQSFVEWFDSSEQPVFKPQKLGALAKSVYEMDWGYGALEAALPGDCYLLPFGSDSCRFLYVADGVTDSVGEYPVLLLDTDDQPYIGVEYPGLDVYLAVHAELVEGPEVYGGLLEDTRFGPRMKEHATRLFGGRAGVEMFEWPEVFGLEDLPMPEM